MWLVPVYLMETTESAPHRDPRCWARTGVIKRTEREFPARCAGLLSEVSLPYLRHEDPRGLGGFVLLLPGGVGVRP